MEVKLKVSIDNPNNIPKKSPEKILENLTEINPTTIPIYFLRSCLRLW